MKLLGYLQVLKTQKKSLTLELGICKTESNATKDDEEMQYLLCGYENLEPSTIHKGMCKYFRIGIKPLS